jgi:sodium/pantothenate symporter
MSGFLVGIVVSMLIYLGVGWYAGRKVKRLEDYYVAGRNAPTLLIVSTLVASFLSTNAFLGEVGMAYGGHAGLLVIVTLGNAAGYVFGALFFGRFLRRSRALTVPEFFGQRFDSHRMQALAGLTIAVGLSCYLLAVTWGISLLIAQVTGISLTTAIIIAWLGYTGFTLYSGSRGVILTDTIMFGLFTFAAMLALYFIVDAAGGWFATVEQLALYPDKPGVIAWHGVIGPESSWGNQVDALVWSLIMGVAWGVVVAVSPWQTSRYLMARSEHVVLRSACGASLAVFLVYLAIYFGAAAINLSKPDIEPPESAMLWVAMNLMPTVAGAMMVSGILAAGLSSASTFLSLTGFSASNDIFRHSHDPQRQLRSTRYTMIGISAIVLVLALVLPSNIFWITYFAGPLFASSWGVVTFMSVWSSRITEAGAFWGMVAGFLGNIGAKLVSLLGGIELPVYLHPILVGTFISLLVVIAVSSRGSVSVREHRYREGLFETPPQELSARDLSASLLWPKAMVTIGVIMIFILGFSYALPYQRALQTQGASGQIGAMMLAVSYGVVIVLTGLLVWRKIRKNYLASGR